MVTAFGSAMISGRHVTIFGDGSSTWDYIYVDDVENASPCAGEASVTTTGRFSIGHRRADIRHRAELRELIAGSGCLVSAAVPTGEPRASGVDPTLAEP